MDWEAIEGRLRPRFETLKRRVTKSYPGIRVSWENTGGVNQRFGYGVSFWYDPANQEDCDLFVRLHCALAATEFYHADGTRAFADEWGRDAIGVDIERNGLFIAPEPELLPADRDSPEYERAVVDYLPHAEAFLDDHVEMILDALRTPFYCRSCGRAVDAAGHEQCA